MARVHLLVIEDDEDILTLLRHHFTREGYVVDTAEDGESGLERAREVSPQIIVLDLLLPGMDGFQVLKALRGDERTAAIPVLILTARGEDADIVTGLELGADDYVVKPFSPRVLMARVRAVLRRKRHPPVSGQNEPIRVFDLYIDPRRHEVRVKNKPVELTATEFQLLRFLASHPGWVYTRQQIVDAVKGSDYPVTDRAVDVQMVGLRRKLGKAGDYIETVRGVGYRFRDEREEG